jgi:hypothetical protein
MLLEAGGVRVLPDEELTAGIALSFAEVGELHTTYDVDSGWIHVSRDLIYSADRYLEFADNIVVGITDEQMMSLWLRPVFTT